MCHQAEPGSMKPCKDLLAAVANVNPASGPTVTLVLSAEPLMVNELGPAVVLMQTLPNAVNAGY